jgi:hypothetical protein
MKKEKKNQVYVDKNRDSQMMGSVAKRWRERENASGDAAQA